MAVYPSSNFGYLAILMSKKKQAVTHLPPSGIA